MLHYFSRLQKQIADNWASKALCDYGGESFSFGEMATQIEKFHILFGELGIRKGDKIAICARNQSRWAISFLAANTYEAVAVPILADFTPENIVSIVGHSESVFLFTDSDLWERLDRSGMPSVRQVVSVTDFCMLKGSESDRSTYAKLDHLLRNKYPDGFGPADVLYPVDNAGDLAIINYTSGSTGDPKGVMLRYECISANMEFGQKGIPCSPGDNILSILPMAHMFGLAFELLYPLCGGATIHYLRRTPSPTLLIRAMKDVRPYLVIAVPMIFEKIYRSRLKPATEKPAVRFLTAIPLLRKLVYAKMRKSVDDAFGGRVRVYIMGGAAVNPEVEEFLQRIGLHFTVGYGMTEAAPLMAYSPWDSFVLRSCGRAMDFVEIRIDSEDPQNVVGEIQAKGVTIFSGYFKNERATRAAFSPDGWFNTGDMGLVDGSGNIFIKGRSKSMLLSSNGQNIYPEEIESEINNLPYVKESLVVSREGKLVALVFPDWQSMEKDGVSTASLEKDTLASINAKVPKYSRISKVETESDPFEKTPKMSIKRFLYK